MDYVDFHRKLMAVSQEGGLYQDFINKSLAYIETKSRLGEAGLHGPNDPRVTRLEEDANGRFQDLRRLTEEINKRLLAKQEIVLPTERRELSDLALSVVSRIFESRRR